LDELDEVKDVGKLFSDWCKKEGVVMPKLDYPFVFEHGLEGIRVNQDIDHREAAIYIPAKLAISVEKVNKHPVLGKIIKENGQLFGRDTIMYDPEELVS